MRQDTLRLACATPRRPAAPNAFLRAQKRHHEHLHSSEACLWSVGRRRHLTRAVRVEIIGFASLEPDGSDARARQPDTSCTGTLDGRSHRTGLYRQSLCFCVPPGVATSSEEITQRRPSTRQHPLGAHRQVRKLAQRKFLLPSIAECPATSVSTGTVHSPLRDPVHMKMSLHSDGGRACRCRSDPRP